ncbi:MAG: hypothetical protein WCF65_03185, partial [Parachlamydiaceae bacterium]
QIFLSPLRVTGGAFFLPGQNERKERAAAEGNGRTHMDEHNGQAAMDEQQWTKGQALFCFLMWQLLICPFVHVRSSIALRSCSFFASFFFLQITFCCVISHEVMHCFKKSSTETQNGIIHILC